MNLISTKDESKENIGFGIAISYDFVKVLHGEIIVLAKKEKEVSL